MNLQDIVFPLQDVIVWTFDSVLVPIGSAGGRRFWEWAGALAGIAGMLYWLRLQAKFNREAADNPDQVK